MATEQQLLDALEQSIANTDRGNSDLLLVMKEGNLNDVTLRDNTVVPSLSKRVKTNTDNIKVEFETSVNQQTQAQLDAFNVDATTSLQNLQTAIDSINNEGNAASATKLQTARKINDIDFDGTQDINIPTVPMGVPIFHGGLRSTIETGYVAYDGQLLSRTSYPIMWAKVQATFPIITDADWLANPSKRGSYSSGDGTTTFRMPDYNGVQTDSLKGLFLRGDGGGTIGGVAVSSGTTLLSDAIRNIQGSLGFHGGSHNSGGEASVLAAATGSFRPVGSQTSYSGAYSVSGATSYSSAEFLASLQVPTAAENRPVSAVGVWICRVGNTLTEVANPTLHAVLTGGNTFNGGQAVVGDLSVSGNFTVNSVGMFGVGQQNRVVTGSRTLGVTYTNPTDKTMIVMVTCQSGSSWNTFIATVNWVEIASTCPHFDGTNLYDLLIFPVSPYQQYKVTSPSANGTLGSIAVWTEYS